MNREISTKYKIGMVLDKQIPPDPRVENEARLLAESRHSVFIFSLNFTGLPEEENYENYTIYRYSISKKIVDKLSAIVNTLPLYYWIVGMAVAEFIDRFGIEVLHLHDLYTIPIGLRANRRKKLPLVVDLHENYPEAIKTYRWANAFPATILVQPGKWTRLEKKYLRKVDRVIVLSDNYRNELKEKYNYLNEHNVYTYPNVPDIEELHNHQDYPVLADQTARFKLLYFGIISERRGIQTCLKALRILRTRIPEVLLVLIGPIDKAEQEEFQKEMQELEGSGHLLYYPWQEWEYIPSFINRSDVCLSPLVKNAQHESGVANKVFQYMAFGKPVIASNCIPQARLVEEERCGLVFKSENVQDLVKSVEQLYSNPKERYQLGLNGQKAIEEKYNAMNYSQILLDLYDSLTEKKFTT